LLRAPAMLLSLADFAQPPWADDHPERLRLDARLAPDHPVRLFDRAVDQLDLTPLLRCYSGRGSRPHRPDLLLKVVLWQLHCKVQSPLLWARAAHELEPLRWLARGLEPAVACWYNFRNRLAPHLDSFNQQVLGLAQDQG